MGEMFLIVVEGKDFFKQDINAFIIKGNTNKLNYKILLKEQNSNLQRGRRYLQQLLPTADHIQSIQRHLTNQ